MNAYPSWDEHLRIGDTEREQAAAALGEHYAQGRLTTEEHSERLDQAWAARQPITESERERFRQVYDQYRDEERRTRVQQNQPVMGRAAEVSIDRVAIARALVECGCLQFRRRRVSLPITRRVAKIS